MSEHTKLFERAAARYEPPDLPLDGLLKRRDRKRRNQRITAGVVGMAVFVAAVWVLGIRVGQDTTDPAEPPTENPTRKTAEDVATDFLYETAFVETDLAVRHLVDASLEPNDGAVFGLGLDGIGEFRRWLSFNEATGFEIIPTSCKKTGSSGSGTYVRCTFDFHGIRSEAIGRGPYGGSYFDLLVARPIYEYGRILDVSAHLETARFGPQMWDPFAEWVSATYPEDAAVMYNDNLTDYSLAPRSIRLWEQRTLEYVKTGPAVTEGENPEPLPVVEPVQIGTVTRSGGGCALEIDAEPIPSGAGRLTVANDTNRVTSFDLFYLDTDVLTFSGFEEFVSTGELYGGVRFDPPPGAFVLTEREVGPGASGTILDNFTSGDVYAVVCAHPLHGIDIFRDARKPIALVGPIVVP